jgi:hypothetical protein
MGVGSAFDCTVQQQYLIMQYVKQAKQVGSPLIRPCTQRNL